MAVYPIPQVNKRNEATEIISQEHLQFLTLIQKLSELTAYGNFLWKNAEKQSLTPQMIQEELQNILKCQAPLFVDSESR